MNNFNFFSSYDEAGKIKNRFSTRRLIIYSLILVLVCVVIYVFFLAQRGQLKSQLAFLAGIKADPKFNERYASTLQLAKDNGVIEKDIAFLEKLEGYAQCADTGDLELKKLIDDCMSENALLNRISVNGLLVSVTGHADSIDTILDIEKNFRRTKKFAFVLMSVVEKDDNLEKFKFTCQLTLDGGAVQYEKAR